MDQLTVEGFSASALVSPAGELEAASCPRPAWWDARCATAARSSRAAWGPGAYVAERWTMGIPLLHPWANRLGSERFEVAGRQVVLDSRRRRSASIRTAFRSMACSLRRLGGGSSGTMPAGDRALLAPTSTSAPDGLMAAFPFPHEIRLDASLTGSALRSSPRSGPRGGGRADLVRLPPLLPASRGRALRVGDRDPGRERLVSTGACSRPGSASRWRSTRARSARGPSTTPTSPGYAGPLRARRRRPADRRLVRSGYPYAQVYAPADDDVIALEPMTSPTNALVTGGPALPLLAPGDSTGRASRSPSPMPALRRFPIRVAVVGHVEWVEFVEVDHVP